ncbi:MAG: hypothetical protein WCG37_07340 [Actinomycetes bacterium]
MKLVTKPLSALALICTSALVIASGPAGASPTRAHETGASGVTATAPLTVTPVPLPKAGSVVKAKGVTRTVLAVAEPANSPGQVLYMTRVKIAPKTKLSEHFHSGVQVARVEFGVLTYKIIQGTVSVTRASGRVQKFTAPAAPSLRKGDSIIETSGLVHFGGNNTNKPVVILTALLINQGAGLSTPVGSAVAGTRIVLPADLEVTSRDIVTFGVNGLNTMGTAVEVGSGILEGEGGSLTGVRAKLNATFLVNYLSGNGTWNATMTMTFADGSTISGTMSGATLVGLGGAAFGGTIGVLGGTGIYKSVTGGTGTYTGSRSGALGATALQTRTELHVLGL